MTLAESLDIVVARTGVERYRYLCPRTWPDLNVRGTRYSGLIMRMAGNVPQTTYPSVATMAGNAIAAAGRVVGAVLTGQSVKVASEVYSERAGDMPGVRVSPVHHGSVFSMWVWRTQARTGDGTLPIGPAEVGSSYSRVCR